MSKLLDGRVRRLLSDPSKWTKGDFAKDELGRPTDPLSDKACRFCLMGAVEREYRGEAFTEACEVIRHAFDGDRTEAIAFNDGVDTTHEHVLELLDKLGV